MTNLTHPDPPYLLYPPYVTTAQEASIPYSRKMVGWGLGLLFGFAGLLGVLRGGHHPTLPIDGREADAAAVNS